MGVQVCPTVNMKYVTTVKSKNWIIVGKPVLANGTRFTESFVEDCNGVTGVVSWSIYQKVFQTVNRDAGPGLTTSDTVWLWAVDC